MGECVKRCVMRAIRGSGVRAVFRILALTILMCIACNGAYAFNIPTGDDNWQLRWDNSLRYFLQCRVAEQDEAILNSPNGDDGDRNFGKGIVSNRLDILSELDLLNKEKNYGIRFSGAFWYDQRYRDRFDNTSVATSNYLDSNGNQTVNRLYDYADRRYAGPGGELLDAFVFAGFEPGGMPTYIKVGRHIYSWGQSLLDPFHGISYGQMPLDLAKAQAMPGVEVKEVFRPTNTISLISQITPEFQLAAQYFLQWERNILPDAGTYFGSADIATEGDGYIIGGIRHGRDIEAARHRDFGLAAQWAPAVLTDTTFGFYYRRFSDKMPSVILNVGDMTYHGAFKSDIDLYGVSFASTIAGLSVGAEISYRQHMPLNATSQYVFSSASLPEDGEILGPTGNVFYGLVNFIGFLGKRPMWDAGTWMLEFDYAHVSSLNDDPKDALTTLSLYKGADGYSGFDRVTKDSGLIHLVVSPQYLQILPGLDLTIPISLDYGLFGVGPCTANNGEGDGQFGLGFNFEYVSRYKLNLQYANYFGKLGTDSTGGAVTRGNYGLYKDRDFISMTVKISF